ncbi:MAG: hypothetical protein HWD59_04945 [Coxiellaceae bacterium]|nr:MAG: hypothetical protein HWD59_04945 [Coxiellaceae bacterium]
MAQLCQSGFSIRGMSIEAYYRLLSFIESYATFNDFYFLKSQSEIPEYFMADLAKGLFKVLFYYKTNPSRR